MSGRRRAVRAPGGLLLAGLLLAACTGGGGTTSTDVDGGSEGGSDGGGPSRPSLTVPPGSDPGAVEPYLTELLVDHDRVVNRIVLDPSVAEDPDDPLIEEYFDLFEVSGETRDGWVAQWVERAGEGLRTEPFSDDHPTTATRLDGDVESLGHDEVAFPYCMVRRYRVVDGDGEVISEVPRQDQPGEGVAVLVDGIWRLRELRPLTNRLECRTEGPEDEPGADEPGAG